MAQAVLSFAISFAVSTAISALFPAEGPRLKDLSVSASTYGNVIPEVWGTVRVGGNMIWCSGIIEHKAEVKAGPGAFYNKYTYTANFAMALCKGPVTSLIRIWANGKLIYDASGESTGIDNGKYAHIFYNGDADQMPDPVMQATVGADNTPAYRGTAYIMFTNFLLSDFGDQIPLIAVEVYKGPDSGVPVLPFTTDGTTQLPHGYSTSQMVVDPTRQVVYMNDNNNGLMVIDATTGILQKTVYPAVGSEGLTSPGIGGTTPNVYDGEGKFSYVYDVADDGGIITSCGGNNNNIRFVKFDPYGFQMTGTFGHSYPFGDSFDISKFNDVADGGPYLDSFLVPLAFNGTSSISGGLFCTNGTFGQLFIIYTEFMGLPAVAPPTPPAPYPVNNKGGPLIQIGNHYTSKVITADFDDGFIVFHSNVGIDDMEDNTMRVWSFSTPIEIGKQWQYETTCDFTFAPTDGSTGNLVQACVLDEMTGNLILVYSTTVATHMASYSRDTSSFVWQTTLPGGFPGQYRAARVLSNQLGWVGVDGRLWIINTSDGTWVNRNPDPNFYIDKNWLTDNDITLQNPGENGYTLPNGTGSGVQYYDGSSGKLYGLAGSGGEFTAAINVNAFASQPTTLADIISDLMLSSGLEPDDFDVSAFLTTNVNGYGYASTVDIKGIIEELSQVYLFDFYERDGKLVGVMRGGSDSVETISYKALGGADGNSDRADYWKEQRLSEADLPVSVALKYINIDADYEENTATSQRISAPVPTMFSRQTETVEVALCLGATEAKNRVNAMLYTTWAERTRHTSKLPLAYSYLEPSDLITVNMADGRSYFERIRQTEFGADFSMNIETNGQDSGAYIFDLIGDGGDGQGQTLNPPVPAYPMIFNTPYLRDVDAAGDGKYSIFYDGTANLVSKRFNGASVLESSDDTVFNTIQVFDKDVEWGTVSGIVPSPIRGCYALDWDTKITVYPAVENFVLESITDDELLSGANMIIIGNEVMQFRDAVENGDGSWTISNLLRGRRGTEWTCDTHGMGEKFTYLTIDTISIAQMSLDAAGKDFWFRAVGTGMSAADALTVEIEYQPRDLMPYAPVHLAATWGMTGLDLSFTRRTRLGGNLMDGTGSVPLIEQTEAYEIDIYDADGNILRTLSANFGVTVQDFPKITYTIDDIDADFVTLPSTLTFEVFQMGITGRGFGTKATVSITGSISAIARYWGPSALTSLAESDILALSGEDVGTDYVKDITYNCSGGNYFYFAFPATYGTPSNVVVNGLPFSAFTVSTVTVGGESYNVLRSDTIQYGSAIPVSWK